MGKMGREKNIKARETMKKVVGSVDQVLAGQRVY